MVESLTPMFHELGLALDSFVVENISLPEELQKLLDQRIGMNMIGDMGRYTQFQVAQSFAYRGGERRRRRGGYGRGTGRRHGRWAQQMMGAMLSPASAVEAPPVDADAPPAHVDAPPAAVAAPVASGASKFCINCGKSLPKIAKFCPECGGAQQ